MPTYRTKDGILLRNVPDGTPEADIRARIEQIRAERGTAPRRASEQSLANARQQYSPTEGMTWGDKFSAGVGKAFVDTGRGVGQLLGLVDQQSVDDAKALDKPLMETGGGITGNIAGQVAQFAVPGGYLARGGSHSRRRFRIRGRVRQVRQL